MFWRQICILLIKLGLQGWGVQIYIFLVLVRRLSEAVLKSPHILFWTNMYSLYKVGSTWVVEYILWVLFRIAYGKYFQYFSKCVLSDFQFSAISINAFYNLRKGLF